MVSQTAWEVTALRAGVHGWLRQSLSARFRLHLRPEVHRYRPLSTAYQAQNPSRLTAILVAPDYDFHRHPRWAGHLRVAVGWHPADTSNERLQVALSGAYSRATSGDGAYDRYALWLTLTLLSHPS